MLIRNIFHLADKLLEAEATSQRRELDHHLSTVDLLILEDFGMKTLRANAAEDLLDIIMRRHEHLPTLITTNRPTEDWAQFLGDIPAATAILDRFPAPHRDRAAERQSDRLMNVEVAEDSCAARVTTALFTSYA